MATLSVRGARAPARRRERGRRRAGEKRNGLRAPAQPTPEPDEEARHGCSEPAAPESARFNPQYGDVQRLGAVDSMTVRSTEGRETLLKLALPRRAAATRRAG